jgi:AcrR family transcriptional regulator
MSSGAAILLTMATRSYTASRKRGSPASVDRVLEAAKGLIAEDQFHTATMDELAAAAGVSRATVFNRFGSKLGVLHELFVRAMDSDEMRDIDEALAIADPVAALDAVVDAGCACWEKHGRLLEQLEAISVLEPDADKMVEIERQEHRSDLRGLARRLAAEGLLRPGLSESRAAAALHMLTSLDSFLWLRRDYGLSLRQTRETMTELARTLLRSESASARAAADRQR